MLFSYWTQTFVPPPYHAATVTFHPTFFILGF